MSEQEIVELAEKHGLCTIIPDAGYPHDALWFDANLIEFATAVAAAEREACAKVCDEHPGNIGANRWSTEAALASCADRIRVRSNA